MASPFDAIGQASTLGGVVLGAVVATLGAFAASSWERRIYRREREADAALVFGELLRALALQIAVLRSAHARGDPFGPITIRMARGVRREIDIYDRNRERLFLIRNTTLRPRVSLAMARLTFALERVLDNTEALEHAPSEPAQAELAAGREQAFGFLLEIAAELPALVDGFAALANTPVADFDLDHATLGMRPPEVG